jgi:uncharacterized protein
VSGFGEATFVQAAGFLKIGDGENPLDGTWIHPESYDVARRVLDRLGHSPAELTGKEAAGELAQKTAELNLDQLAGELQVGRLTLGDVVAQLSRPGRDPREDLPPPIFKTGILKLEDLAPGMELYGSVLNVVDFGAFVDIGLRDSGLVHVSQLANRYIRDPHEVAAVGDIVKVWVLEVDKTRRRVSLTMIPPGSKRHEPSGRSHGGRSHGGRSHGERSNGQRDGGQPTGGAQAGGQPSGGEPARGGGRQRRGSRPPRPGTPATQPAATADASPAGAASADGASPDAAVPAIAASGEKSSTSSNAERSAAPPRPPYGKKPYGQSHGKPSRGGDHSRPAYRPPPKPKPMIPITEAMKKGKEPLRTFGDLKQFFEIKATEPTEKPAAEEPKSGS